MPVGTPWYPISDSFGPKPIATGFVFHPRISGALTSTRLRFFSLFRLADAPDPPFSDGSPLIVSISPSKLRYRCTVSLAPLLPNAVSLSPLMMISATSQSQSVPSSWHFFNSPAFRFRNVSLRRRSSLIRSISMRLRPIFSCCRRARAVAKLGYLTIWPGTTARKFVEPVRDGFTRDSRAPSWGGRA